MVHHEQQNLSAADGHEIRAQLWKPDGGPQAVIQIVHGLGEHSDRYERFAAAAVQRGYVVCTHDHRGHGGHGDEPGHFADKDGWRKVVADVETVNDYIRERYPDLEIVLLGHSMGSFIAQAFAMHHGGRLAGMLLSGSNWPSKLLLLPSLVLANVECWRLGKRGSSPLLDKLGFGNFNKAFEPARTELDWLSRDEAEVDKYVASPLCGGPYTCGLWRDLLRGLLSVASDKALMRIPADLRIMITGGGDDPVGGDKGMGKLLMHYAQTSHQRLTPKIYAGGRHEMLNEVNRDEVTSDWLNWADATTGISRSG